MFISTRAIFTEVKIKLPYQGKLRSKILNIDILFCFNIKFENPPSHKFQRLMTVWFAWEVDF